MFFFAFRGSLDLEKVCVDGTIVRVHQHASGARDQKAKQAIGKSVGGNTTKVHMICDSTGKPIDFELTGGQVHDSIMANFLLDKAKKAEKVLGDKAYDSEGIREYSRNLGITPIIPRRSNSTKENPEFQEEIYKKRHIIENLFARLKHFRGFATRFEKLAKNFKSMIYLASACVCMGVRLKCGQS